MNLTKHLEFFDPTQIDKTIHIIGLGAVGSHVALMLTRLGCTKFRLYEFDIVNPHNLANQNFTAQDIHKDKLSVTKDKMLCINPDIDIVEYPEGYSDQKLFGFVFLCLDSIDLRRTIATDNIYNPNILAMADFRMGLSDAQHYLTDWHDEKAKETFIKSMQFTSAEAKEAQPVSACGTSMSIIPTVWTLVALGIANFINLYKKEPYKKIILFDTFIPEITSF